MLSVEASGSGPVKLLNNGTGLTSPSPGIENVTMTFTGVGGRYQSGAKKGECEQEEWRLRSRCSPPSSAAVASWPSYSAPVPRTFLCSAA